MNRQTVAVIGAGVSGMTAAYLLQRRYDVTVFEARSYLGGNAHTEDATLPDGTTVPVDVAFMAYDESYPNFKRLMTELKVDNRPANIAIDVVCTGCGFAHMGGSPFGDNVIPDRPDGVDHTDWERFVAELRRFPADLLEILGSDRDTTLSVGEFLADRDYSDYFFQHFVYPRVGPWWLNGPGSVHAMSLEFLLSTMRKYDLLGADAFASWRVVVGGTREYLGRIAEQLTAVHIGDRVREIHRTADGVQVRADGTHTFDKAVIAVHPPTALELLKDATPRERELLGVFRYMPLDVTLHTDASVFPQADHSGFSMRVSCRRKDITFRGFDIDAAIIQRLDTSQPLIASYNGADQVRPDTFLSQSSYEHPVFNKQVFAAQRHLPELSGDRVAFAGAYFGSGFHEDGCASGVRAAEALGVSWE